MPMIKVLIADDHPLIREGLTMVLSLDPSIDTVGQADNGQIAIIKAEALKPHVILMDINMPFLNGIEATKIIKQKFPEIKIIALTVADDNDKIMEVMNAGVSGYILKDISPDVLIATIKAVHAGETVIHPKITSTIFSQFKKSRDEAAAINDNESLTEREKEILTYMAKGINNKEIAKALFISEKTVKNHITNIFRKINVSDRTQAVLHAIKARLVDVNKEL